MHMHHIRFRATAAGTTLEFSDAAATPGEELDLNYVMLKPYFEAAR